MQSTLDHHVVTAAVCACEGEYSTDKKKSLIRRYLFYTVLCRCFGERYLLKLQFIIDLKQLTCDDHNLRRVLLLLLFVHATGLKLMSGA